MNRILKATLVGSMLAAAIWAVGCEGTRSPARPDPSATLAFNVAPPSAPVTVSWHCMAAAAEWRAADCVAPRGNVSIGARTAAALSAPNTPTSLTVSVTAARVSLSWTAPIGGDAPTSYVVEAGSASGRVDLANFDTGTSAPSLVVDNVPAGTYFVRVRAKNAAGVSGASNEVALTVAGSGACAPTAPANLVASAVGSTVTLQWAGSGGACVPTGYVIEAGSAPGAANLANFNTGTTATTFIASNVGAGTYFIRVRGANAAGTSAPSNEATLVVGGSGCAAAPAAPTLAGSVVNSTVSLSWSAVPGATSYILEAGSAPGLSNVVVSDQGGATSLAATASAGTYYVRVKARNACGTSAPSNEIALTVGVVQPQCLFTVSPASVSISNAGGSATAAVSVAAGCQWNAVSNASFITITSGASGNGSGTVAYSVAANAGSTSRTGTLTIAGQTVTVTQGGSTLECTFTVSPTSANFDAVGGNTTFTITASAPTCAWTAQSLVGIISITGPTSGTGNGTTTAQIQANPGAQRTGSVAIAGKNIPISQDAPLPPLNTRTAGCPSGGKAPMPDDTLIQFINANGSSAIAVSPLDASGNPVSTQTLGPNTGFKADTKVDTVFQVKTVNGGCISYYIAVAGGKSAIVP